MADGLDLTEIVRRTVQANARFYKGWVDLSLDYMRGISEIFGGSGEADSPVEGSEGGGAGVLVLEAEEGATARGAFLVTNDLGRTVSCELVASAFADAGGKAVRPKTTFEPAKLALSPGEQRVVHASIPIDGNLTPGAPYTGELSIRGMDGFTVPVVLRRLHGVVERPAAGGKPDEEGAAPAGSGKRAARVKPVAGKRGGGKKASRPKRVAKQKD